jgi:hypothetical protein
LDWLPGGVQGLDLELRQTGIFETGLQQYEFCGRNYLKRIQMRFFCVLAYAGQ